jgi:hypothetical protein
MKRHLSVVSVAYFLCIGTMLLLAIRASVEPTIVSEIVPQRPGVDIGAVAEGALIVALSPGAEPRQLGDGSYDNPYSGLTVSASAADLVLTPTSGFVLALHTSSATDDGGDTQTMIATQAPQQVVYGVSVDNRGAKNGWFLEQNVTNFAIAAPPAAPENVFPRAGGTVVYAGDASNITSNVIFSSPTHFNSQNVSIATTETVIGFSINSGCSSSGADCQFDGFHITGLGASDLTINNDNVISTSMSTVSSGSFGFLKSNAQTYQWYVEAGSNATSTVSFVDCTVPPASGGGPTFIANNGGVYFTGKTPAAGTFFNSLSIPEFNPSNWFSFWGPRTPESDPKKPDADVPKLDSEE